MPALLRLGRLRRHRISVRCVGWQATVATARSFRTVGTALLVQPSADLLDTLYTCQQRQEWYRDFLRTEGDSSPLSFVGSVTLTTDIEAAAEGIRTVLGFDLEHRRALPTWTDALLQFIVQADSAGVLVMVSGVVGNNNRRKLDPGEFRGFALSDPLAPLVFINGADTKAAQMFTLAHELAHVWLGVSALSNVEPTSTPTHVVEEWCNRVTLMRHSADGLRLTAYGQHAGITPTSALTSHHCR